MNSSVSPSDLLLDKQLKRFNTPLEHLEYIVNAYLEEHKGLSVNSLSKRCGISEATLRRINSKNAKKVPTPTTIWKILSYISNQTKHDEILNFFPGPLTDYIKEVMPANPNTQYLESSVDLSNRLSDPVKYLIYKMSSDTIGVSKDRVERHFGRYGLEKLAELKQENLIREDESGFFAVYKNFRLSHESFKNHFKATADFIKPEKLPNTPTKSSQLFYNCSESINIKAYESILRVQRSALKKIRTILWDPASEGDISTFVIGAIDTLCSESAYEISESTISKLN